MNKNNGTSGRREGYKLYCFNTSIRMPDKNVEFLEILKKYEGKLVTSEVKIDIYKDAIQSGALTPVNMNSNIKNKIRRGENLTETEMYEVMEHNEPSNGFTGRVGDYIMSLENQAFIQRLGTQRKYRIRLTELGNRLLKGLDNEQDLYTKAMIGLEYGSTSRITVNNKANPFLNTIFVISELRKKYSLAKSIFKGITLFEFGLFVLTMKDCKYKKAVENIVNYRNGYGLTENETFAKNYLKSNGIQPYAKETLYGSASYSDEVLRKFKKTGLIVEKRTFQTRYINFNEFELEKICLLLDKYRNYSWKAFNSDDDYYEYIENIVLPWEESASNYYKIAKYKAKIINYNLDKKEVTSTDYEEINKLYYQFVFENKDYNQFPYENIVKELQLIDRTVEGDSSLSDIEEYVRFEWFTSLLLANKFGKENVKANLILDDNGLPLSQAPGNNPDVELSADNFHYNIEVTTIRNRSQQLNAETTTVARHLSASNNDSIINKALFIAPFIHEDTIRYYRFEAKDLNVTILPITLEAFLKIVEKAVDIEQFDAFIEECSDKLKNSSIIEYEEFISDYE